MCPIIIKQDNVRKKVNLIGVVGYNVLKSDEVTYDEIVSHASLACQYARSTKKIVVECTNELMEMINSVKNIERTFNSMDLNRSTHIKNSLSNLILQAALDLGVDFVGDFHSTAFNSNPGFESIFSSKSPSPESFLIANYISREVGSEVISFDFAGSTYKGAVEDVCNLKGIPAVTCEVLCPFGNVAEGSAEKSLSQMKSFLDYFGF